MRSAAAAFAWELRWRHRWGLTAVALYLIGLGALRLFWIRPGQTILFEERWSFAWVVVVPAATTFMYFLAIFSFGLAGDLGARRSIYPSRFFTYPLRDAELVKWPMLYGTLAMIGLWVATRQLALWPTDAVVPVIWPALFAAVILAWTQALTWMPYPIRGLRVMLIVMWLAAITFGALLALFLGVPEGTMLAILAPQAILAYVAARIAISRARHGDGAERRSSSPVGRLSTRSRRPVAKRGYWSSPMRAQIWLEWRRQGRSLPTLVALLMPFELYLLFVFRETPNLVWTTFAAALLTPPFLAIFSAATVQRSSRSGSDTYELTPFLATRPLTSTSLIGAKLIACLLSALATWLIVLISLVLGLYLSGTWPIVAEGFAHAVDLMGEPRARAVWALGLLGLISSTWKLLVQSLFVGLSGRPWLVKSSVFITLLVLGALLPFTPWILDNGRAVIAGLWNALPWLLLTLVLVKMSAAVWAAKRLVESRLVAGSWLVSGALCWDGAVFAVYGLLLWLVPTVLVREYLLMMVAVLAVPLARLSAAPLALTWNRHR